jgi:molybdopterin adenylyltransferase
MRETGRRSTHLAAISRAVAVTRGRTLIINLPGSERGAHESLEAVLDLLPHAVDLLRGDAGEHHPIDSA